MVYSRAETETALGRASRDCTPPRISPSCPHCLWLWLGRSTNAGAVIARQACHSLLSGRTDPLTTFLAALMQISAQVGHRAFLQCRLPFAGHTSGCFSASGYSFDKVHKRIPISSELSPHYLSGFRAPLIAKFQKLHTKFIYFFSFDRIFLRRLRVLFWLIPRILAYSRSDLPSK